MTLGESGVGLGASGTLTVGVGREQDRVKEALVFRPGGERTRVGRVPGHLAVVVERRGLPAEHNLEGNSAGERADASVDGVLGGREQVGPVSASLVHQLHEHFAHQAHVTLGVAVHPWGILGGSAVLDTVVSAEVRDHSRDKCGLVIGLQDTWGTEIDKDTPQTVRDRDGGLVRKRTKNNKSTEGINQDQANLVASASAWQTSKKVEGPLRAGLLSQRGLEVSHPVLATRPRLALRAVLQLSLDMLAH